MKVKHLAISHSPQPPKALQGHRCIRAGCSSALLPLIDRVEAEKCVSAAEERPAVITRSVTVVEKYILYTVFICISVTVSLRKTKRKDLRPS